MASIIETVSPLNILEEKSKFQQDQNYNPQFIYGQVFTTDLLYAYGQPQAQYLDFAQQYLQQITPKLFSQKKPEKVLTQREISQQTRKLFNQLKLNPPLIHWQNIPGPAKRKKETLIFNPQAKITSLSLAGILAHEVQTHLLRSHNQSLQTLKRSKSRDYARTEEGLAVLNSRFAQQKIDFTSVCQRYLVCSWAMEGSFASVFARFRQFSNFTFERAWNYTVRVKRGLTDTSEKGGFVKDIVYLEGLLAVFSWLLQPENKLSDLYLGKISLDQVEEYRQAAQKEDLIYPTFIGAQGQVSPDYLDFLQSCKQQLGLLLPEKIRLGHNN